MISPNIVVGFKISTKYVRINFLFSFHICLNLNLFWVFSSQHSWILKGELWIQKLFEREFSMEALSTNCEERLVNFFFYFIFKFKSMCRLVFKLTITTIGLAISLGISCI